MTFTDQNGEPSDPLKDTQTSDVHNSDQTGSRLPYNNTQIILSTKKLNRQKCILTTKVNMIIACKVRH